MFLLFNEKTSFSHISLIKNRINHKRVGLSLEVEEVENSFRMGI